MNDTISLVNTQQRMAVLTLAHTEYCKALGRCECRDVPGKYLRRLARSLTIPSEAKVDGLPSAILAVPQVVNAVRVGDLLIRREPRMRSNKSKRSSDAAAPKSEETKTAKRGRK